MNKISRSALVALLSLLGGQHCLAQEGDAAPAQEVADRSVQMRDAAPQVQPNLFAKYVAPEDLMSDPMFIRSAVPVQFVPERPKSSKRLWLGLVIMGQLAAAGDVTSTTLILRRGGVESDPTARPFTGLPRPAYVLSSVAIGGAVSALGLKMQESQRFHRVWWVPQALQIVGNTLCTVHNAEVLAHW